MKLGAVKTDGAQLEQFHFLGQFQHLHKQRFQFGEKAPAEGGQRVMVRMAAGGDVAKGNRIIGRSFKPAAGEHARGIAIHQDRQQGGRMMRLRASSRVLTGQV
jgi:hypothetical protein